MRYTECRMAPLALEMVRDIDEDTVDFQPNYDGRSQEPTVLPARYPNLLVNGSAGIAVGMATSIPPHNLREVADGARWALEHPDATREELLEALIERIKGPDFPNAALIVGREGIEQAYRTGRGSITQRAVIEVDEDAKGRTQLVITELPYMVNPDNLALKIAELADSGRVQGIADVRDDTSDRTGQRLVIVLKRDAVARVVLNNLLKHTELQTNFSANMLALVDGVPRTLTIDQFVSNWVDHQIDVIQRRTRYRLARGGALGPHPARSGEGARRARRGDRADPPLARGRRRAHRPDGAAGRSTTSRPTRSWRCSCAGWPRSSARRSSTGWPSSRSRSPTSRTSSRSPSGSARSSWTSSPRSSTSTATSGAPRSSRPTATSRWRT